jgi:cytochrome P450
VCEHDTVLGSGEDCEAPIAKGSTILAMTPSAMFDPKALTKPEDFDTNREQDNRFHFGLVLHEW